MSSSPGNPMYFEDFVVGETRRYGGRTVTAEEIVRFGREFDPQPYHVDPEAAKASIFGELVASGLHTWALTLRMTFDEYLAGGTALASPGADELRWKRPVYAGDTIWVTTTIAAVVPSLSRSDRGLVKMAHVVRNQRDEVVMTVIGMAFFARRPQPAAATPR